MRSGIYLAVCFIFFNGCFGSKAPQGQTNMPRKATYFNNNGLTLKSATSHDSAFGQNGEMNIDYIFKISVVTKDIVTFDSVWIGQKPLHVSVSNEGSGEMKVPLGSTIALNASDNNSLQTSMNTKSPVPYQGEGLIRYLLNGKPYYLVVKQFETPKKSKK